MEGRQGSQGKDPWDKNTGRRIAALNGTGKHRPVPQRPRGMPPDVEQPPTPRVARPKRGSNSPRNIRRGLLLLGGVFLICALIACGIGYAAFNYFNGLSASAGASTTASNFITALSGPKPDYNQAYQDLGPSITLQLSMQDFTAQAQKADTCYGSITNFTEIAGSAQVQGNSQSYSYTVTRAKLKNTYQLNLTLQPDQEVANTWKVTKYDDDLPVSSSCK